ncbi:MAG: response regulator [Candidatus Levyibacteriota bacterium]|nr:MAG: response regulator [Candidatus Levybacteria bacterium]
MEKKKILIVEDDQYTRDFYEELLAQEGYEIITAANGKEGQNIAMQQNPDLILLDIILPDVDGITIFQNLKAKNITIPVIFLTNAGDTSNLLQAVEGKAADFLIKSNVQPEALLKRIKEVLNLS